MCGCLAVVSFYSVLAAAQHSSYTAVAMSNHICPLHAPRLAHPARCSCAGAVHVQPHLVQLRDSVAAQRRHIPSCHDGVVQAAGAREALGGHGLAGAGGAWGDWGAVRGGGVMWVVGSTWT